jgi:hypothetical protein
VNIQKFIDFPVTEYFHAYDTSIITFSMQTAGKSMAIFIWLPLLSDAYQLSVSIVEKFSAQA